MKFHINKIILLAVSIILIFSYGCSNRGTNSGNDLDLQEGGILKVSGEGAHVFFNEFITQIRNKFQQLEIVAYIPKVTLPYYLDGTIEPVPLLILLPPQDGDQYYYFNHGLKEIADELISNGTIQPMIIACVSNDRTFGGYFFGGHSPAAGNYDTLIGGTLVDYLHSTIPFAINSTNKRAIGGVGMGAYGALRAALLHPGVFSSISAVNGPLDFDGSNGAGGFINLFDDALLEQGILNDDLNKFDSSGAWHLSRLFIGGALAFSPHDTAITWDSTYNSLTGELLITLLSRQIITDSTTIVTDIINDEFNYDFHMPFDSTGNKYDLIWNMWLNNNLENILTPAGDQLNGVNLWIGSSPEATFGAYYEQTQSWINTLTGAPYSYPVATKTYSGYPGNPADDNQYVYDLLKDILIFHSENFGN